MRKLWLIPFFFVRAARGFMAEGYFRRGWPPGHIVRRVWELETRLQERAK